MKLSPVSLPATCVGHCLQPPDTDSLITIKRLYKRSSSPPPKSQLPSSFRSPTSALKSSGKVSPQSSCFTEKRMEINFYVSEQILELWHHLQEIDRDWLETKSVDTRPGCQVMPGVVQTGPASERAQVTGLAGLYQGHLDRSPDVADQLRDGHKWSKISTIKLLFVFYEFVAFKHSSVKLISNKIFKAIDPVKASKSDKTNTNKGTEPKKKFRKKERHFPHYFSSQKFNQNIHVEVNVSQSRTK